MKDCGLWFVVCGAVSTAVEEVVMAVEGGVMVGRKLMMISHYVIRESCWSERVCDIP